MEVRILDFSALEAYVMVCREGKMSRAAEKLFMSKQTLSMIIKRIENEMGVELLVRASSGVEMTAEGKQFYSYALKILSLWKACCGQLESMRTNQRARLTVGFGYMIWNFWTKEMSEAFERQYPGIELVVEGELSRELLHKMDEGQLDMVITCMQSERYAQYDSQLLRSMDLLVTMAREDPLAQKEVLTPWDLEGRKLIYPDSGGDFLRRFCRFLEELGIGAQGELAQAGNFLRMLHTVREERALKLSNQFYASVVPAVDGYVSKPLTYSGQPAMPQVSVYALMPAGRVRSMAANRFIDFFVRQVLCAEPAGMA